MYRNLNTKIVISVLVLLLSALPALTDTSGDSKVYEIADELMCPVCSGQTVANSNSDLARDMRSIIKKMLKQGKTEEQIISYFTERYGDTILASPPKRGVNLILWLLPLTGLIAGFAFLVIYLRNETRDTHGTEDSESGDDNPDEETLKRINSELDRDI